MEEFTVQPSTHRPEYKKSAKVAKAFRYIGPALLAAGMLHSCLPIGPVMGMPNVTRAPSTVGPSPTPTDGPVPGLPALTPFPHPTTTPLIDIGMPAIYTALVSVKTPEGQPIAGIEITSNSGIVVTNAQGQAQVDVYSLNQQATLVDIDGQANGGQFLERTIDLEYADKLYVVTMQVEPQIVVGVPAL